MYDLKPFIPIASDVKLQIRLQHIEFTVGRTLAPGQPDDRVKVHRWGSAPVEGTWRRMDALLANRACHFRITDGTPVPL